MKPENASPASDDAARARAGEKLITHNARLGLVFFAIYLVIYGGFMLVSVFWPQVMARRLAALGGVNVAIAYGMALIVTAFVLAVLYMVLCKREANGEGK